MRYNAGDKIVIREDLVPEVRYGEYILQSDMAEHRGETLTIERVDSSDYVTTNGHMFWTDEMVDHAKSRQANNGGKRYSVGDVVVMADKNTLMELFYLSDEKHLKYADQIVTIASNTAYSRLRDGYAIEEDNEETCWDEDAIDHEATANLPSLINEDREDEDVMEKGCIYNVGDKVILRSDLKTGDTFEDTHGYFTVTKEIEAVAGTSVIIQEVHSVLNAYGITIAGSSFGINDDMIDHDKTSELMFPEDDTPCKLQFKVGDIVVLGTSDFLQFRHMVFGEELNTGKEVIITDIIDGDFDGDKYYASTDVPFTFDDEEIDISATKALQECSSPDESADITYNIGDAVIVRDDLVLYSGYSGVQFVDEMVDIKLIIISDIDCDGDYLSDDGFYYSQEMIDHDKTSQLNKLLDK